MRFQIGVFRNANRFGRAAPNRACLDHRNVDARRAALVFRSGTHAPHASRAAMGDIREVNQLVERNRELKSAVKKERDRNARTMDTMNTMYDETFAMKRKLSCEIAKVDTLLDENANLRAKCARVEAANEDYCEEREAFEESLSLWDHQVVDLQRRCDMLEARVLAAEDESARCRQEFFALRRSVNTKINSAREAINSLHTQIEREQIRSEDAPVGFHFRKVNSSGIGIQWGAFHRIVDRTAGAVQALRVLVAEGAPSS